MSPLFPSSTMGKEEAEELLLLLLLLLTLLLELLFELASEEAPRVAERMSVRYCLTSLRNTYTRIVRDV